MALNVGIAGVTGLVGQNIIKILSQYDLDFGEMRFLASKDSLGEEISFKGKNYPVEELKESSFKGLDYVFFALGDALSKKYAGPAIDAGAIVIDNSNAFRMEEGVPLVIPEFNFDSISKDDSLISNPNCSTIQSVLALAPLYENYGIRRIVYSTYQAVSGSGRAGIEDLERGYRGRKAKFYPREIVSNVIPHIDDFLDNGYSKEELKMIEETKKIFAREDMGVTATAVRVPVKVGHSVSINVEVEEDFTMEDIRDLYRDYPGIYYMDGEDVNNYGTPLDAVARDDVIVSRIRRDESLENGLNLWSVADNLIKGAAGNAVQIFLKLVDR